MHGTPYTLISNSSWKSSQDTRHLRQAWLWDSGLGQGNSGKTPALPMEKTLPPVGAQCLPSAAPLVTLGQSLSPELSPALKSELAPTRTGKDTAAGVNHSPSTARSPPALSPSATSLQLLNPQDSDPTTALDNTFSENIFPNTQPKLPLLELEAFPFVLSLVPQEKSPTPSRKGE